MSTLLFVFLFVLKGRQTQRQYDRCYYLSYCMYKNMGQPVTWLTWQPDRSNWLTTYFWWSKTNLIRNMTQHELFGRSTLHMSTKNKKNRLIEKIENFNVVYNSTSKYMFQNLLSISIYKTETFEIFIIFHASTIIFLSSNVTRSETLYL